MAYGYNKNAQVIGDLIASDDPQRDTKIDFSNDQINFIVSGSTIASLTPTQFSSSLFFGNGSGLVNFNTGSNGTGSNSISSFASSNTWTFNHNLNNRTPIIQVLDTSYNVIIPQNIELSNSNTAIITFPTNEAGYAIASLGGLGVSASYAATASYVQTLNQNLNVNGNITGSIVVATNNGAGTNFKIGDDIWIGDINIANTMQLMGQQVSANGYIKFGNGASNPILGASNSSTLNLTGILDATGPINIKFVQGVLSADQSINNATDTVIQFVDHYDTNGWLTSYQFKPTIAGYYEVYVNVLLESPGVSNNQANIQMRLNGTTQVLIQQVLNSVTNQTLNGSKIIYFNGSTDYVDFTAYQGSGATKKLLQGAAYQGTWFTAKLISG